MSDKVNVTVTLPIDADDLWSRIFGAEPWAFGTHWKAGRYAEGTDWDKAGKITVSLEDPEHEEGSGKLVTKTLDINDIVAALAKCPPHIVADVIQDNTDCISSDYVVQVAVFGSCIYG